MSKSVAAALFDVDGTLVDSNYLHAVTWWEAFIQAGYQVPMADIHRVIGMGSDQMLDALLPAGRDKDGDTRLSSAHSALYGTDLVQVALAKAGVRPEEAVFTGDTSLGRPGLPQGRGAVHRLAERRHQPR